MDRQVLYAQMESLGRGCEPCEGKAHRIVEVGGKDLDRVRRRTPVLDGGDEVLSSWKQGHLEDLALGIYLPATHAFGLVLVPLRWERDGTGEKTLGFDTGEVRQGIACGGRDGRETVLGAGEDALPYRRLVRAPTHLVADLDTSSAHNRPTQFLSRLPNSENILQVQIGEDIVEYDIIVENTVWHLGHISCRIGDTTNASRVSIR